MTDPTPIPEPGDQEQTETGDQEQTETGKQMQQDRLKLGRATERQKRGYRPGVIMGHRPNPVAGVLLAAVAVAGSLGGGRLMPLDEDPSKPRELTKHDQERLDAAAAKRARKAARKS